MKILYIGRYELPDKDATANRVTANAKLLRDLGHTVVLAGWSEGVKRSEGYKRSEYFGFECFEKYKERTAKDKLRTFSDASLELAMLKDGGFELVIAYNYPAVAFKKIFRFCKKKGIKCIADVTEWFTNSNPNPLFRIVKTYDNYLRMKKLHKQIDGLIVISRYLQNCYAEQKTVLIPPLADTSDEKWSREQKPDDGKVRFIYAGWPSRAKERLDLIVEALGTLSGKYPVQLDVYGVDAAKYCEIYGLEGSAAQLPYVNFHGRVSHLETVSAVKNADYSLIVREHNRKNDAGFPSKLTESVSCGTPVLVTDISNVSEFVGDGKNGFIISVQTLRDDLENAILRKNEVSVERDLFDYHKYVPQMKRFLDGLSE